MKQKTFDCVRMKHEIQARLEKQWKGKSWAERNAAIREAMRRDPYLRRLLKDEAEPGG